MIWLKENFVAIVLFAVLFAASMMRPVLPVDETRYLTAAWEMWLKKDLIHLTVNFEPYSHKPPLLFWLINAFWAVFGVSRWAALIPILISTLGVILLTGKLARKLFPEGPDIALRARLLLMGGAPFLIYGSLIMFDVMLCFFMLASILCLLEYAEKKRFIALVGYGLCMGFGVLTKGPVIYLCALPVALFAPFWMMHDESRRWLRWYGSCVMAALISAAPVALWLGPLIASESSDFLYWLLWKQTAGRITGGFSDIHPRPFYFYLLILPLFVLPWAFFPAFWRGIKNWRLEWKELAGLRLLTFWFLAAFIAFSLITGKQPHYLLPLMPALIIGMAWFMRTSSLITIRGAALCMMTIFLVAHVVATTRVFASYDLSPVAAMVHEHQDKDWAFVNHYSGEIGFLGRIEKPIESINEKDLPAWFSKHRDGYVIMRSGRSVDQRYVTVLSKKYRSTEINVLAMKNNRAAIARPKKTQDDASDVNDKDDNDGNE